MANRHIKYNRKSIKEKKIETINRSHPAPTACIFCEIRMLPTDRAAHRESCAGRLEPVENDYWCSVSYALAAGVQLSVLRRMGHRGVVRVREGDSGEQEYLLRDVEQVIDARRLLIGES